ncbi:sulfotransferase family protein [Desulfurivibrio sp. D14AmB]|uniref:sulfotransferase family protein n=1 Tax=Desulfurivibrio sp. D14AmB TaxID=3374370 RepID=UPI00376F23E4
MSETGFRQRPIFGEGLGLPRSVSYGIALLHWSLLSLRPDRVLRLLLILSHQRSGSTLLLQCLNTHPMVMGYGETLMTYRRASDLYCLPTKVAVRLRRPFPGAKYFLDKLLYDELLADERLLQLPCVYTIFLLRDPDQALPSLINAPKLEGWVQRPEANRDYVDQANCERYYSGRLATLARYAELVPRDRSLFLTYDDILHHTQSVFHALAKILGVENRFSEHYPVMRTTGVAGLGDVSPHIRGGQIKRDIKRPPVKVEPALLNSARQSFEASSRIIDTHCTRIK